MPTLSALTLRFACDQSNRDLLPNIGTTTDVVIYKASPVDIQCAVFTGEPASGTLSSTTGWTGATLKIRKNDANGTLLLDKNLDPVDLSASSWAAWDAGTGQQFTFELSEVDTNQTMPSDGTLEIYGVITISTSTEELVVGRFSGVIRDSGLTAGTPTPPLGLYYTQAEIDSLLSNLAMTGAVVITTTSGTQHQYVPTENNDTARGIALTNAFAAHVDGDSIVVSSGTFTPATVLRLKKASLILSQGTTIKLANQGSSAFSGDIAVIRSDASDGSGASITGTGQNSIIDCNVHNQTASNASIGAFHLAGNCIVQGIRAINWGSKSNSFENFVGAISVPNTIESHGAKILGCYLDTPAPIVLAGGTSAFGIFTDSSVTSINVPTVGWIFEPEIAGCVVRDVTVGTASGQPNYFHAFGFASVYGGTFHDNAGYKLRVNSAATTIASGSNGATLPQATINVVSTTNFASSGDILVTASGGIKRVSYTGKTSNTFTGCSGGTTNLATGNTVTATGSGDNTFYYQDSYSANSVTVHHNTMLEVENGISFVVNSPATSIVKNVVIDGNTIVTSNSGISVAGNAAPVTVNGIHIFNNTIRPVTGVSPTYGITLGLLSNSSVINNIIDTSTAYYDNGGVGNLVWQGNKNSAGAVVGTPTRVAGTEMGTSIERTTDLAMFDFSLDNGPSYFIEDGTLIWNINHDDGVMYLLSLDSSGSNFVFPTVNKMGQFEPVAASAGKSIRLNSGGTAFEAYDPAAVFTTSAALAGLLSDETGFTSGAFAVFSINPIIRNLDVAMGALVIDVTLRNNTKTVSTELAFTLSGTPVVGSMFGLKLTNSDTSAHTMTLPTGTFKSENKGGTVVTTFAMPASSTLSFLFEVESAGVYRFFGEPLTVNDATSKSTPVGADSVYIYDSVIGSDAKATITNLSTALAGLSAFTGAFQPMDSDLTTLAGLTATTDNFIVSVASAWASRTPSQVRSTLGLVIGTNVQTWNADLDSWAAITRASGFDTFVATPTTANLKSLITDETTVGWNLFSATNPSAISFPKVAADNTVSFRTPAQVLSDIGAQASGSYAASGANTDITSLGAVTRLSPASNSTTAVKITKADGSTVVSQYDTTNGFVGIGTATPVANLDVRDASGQTSGAARITLNNSMAFGGVPAAKAAFLSQNMYYDGTNDVRIDTASEAARFLIRNDLSGNDRFDFQTVAAGANPITWTTRMLMNSSYILNVAAGFTTAGTLTVTGASTLTGAVTIGSSGTAITKVLSATATLDFGSTAAGAVSDLTITVTGAALGDVVSLGIPNASIPASGTFSAWVSATDTVTVRYENNDLLTTRDPASGTFRAMVIKF